MNEAQSTHREETRKALLKQLLLFTQAFGVGPQVCGYFFRHFGFFQAANRPVQGDEFVGSHAWFAHIFETFENGFAPLGY